MSYAFWYDAPGNEHIYRLVSAAIGEQRPDGLLAGVVTRVDGGLRHLNVWESREKWVRFRDGHVQPAVAGVLEKLGIPAPAEAPEEHELDLVDVSPA
jgi:hypothetical protein